MNSTEDRRSPATTRVPHTALVDICSQSAVGAPFQAESTNISGRGMLVRTSFLPEIGEPLVCRFHHDDHEILVEGLVAWRSEGQDSGEFGIQFTALDADSAHVLQSLGEPVSGREKTQAQVETPEDEDPSEFLEVGSRVRLHIDGLASPMKACVHEGTTRKIRVGSSLEFLKVGRALQLEGVDHGERRGAEVEAVNVVINPSTCVPELVVQLRYEGASKTPPPVGATTAQVDFDDEAFGPVVENEKSVEDLEDDEPHQFEPVAEALRARLSVAINGASNAAQRARSIFSEVAESTRKGVTELQSKRASTPKKNERASTAKRRRVQSTHRRTRPAPSHLRSGIHDLGLASKPGVRKAERSSKASAEPVRRRRLSPAALFGTAFIALAVSAFALRMTGETAETTEATAEASAAAETSETVAATQTTARVAPAAEAKAAAPKKDPEQGVVAEVPLFGPQAMAVKKAEVAPMTISVAEAEKRAAAAAVPDQGWEEPEATPDTTTVKPWGRGRLYLPTIHRIRLDGAGAGLVGAVNDDGFTVVVPERKAMESGKVIEKRDKRIINVKTSNNARGTSVQFEFRGPVPAYRVRLRKDFVEFLISAPENTVARL